jgi:hypothetical protein
MVTVQASLTRLRDERTQVIIACMYGSTSANTALCMYVCIIHTYVYVCMYVWEHMCEYSIHRLPCIYAALYAAFLQAVASLEVLGERPCVARPVTEPAGCQTSPACGVPRFTRMLCDMRDTRILCDMRDMRGATLLKRSRRRTESYGAHVGVKVFKLMNTRGFCFHV